MMLRRRTLAAAALSAALPAALPGCGGGTAAEPPVRWIGVDAARGHRLRPAAGPASAAVVGAAPASTPPDVQRRADVVVVGSGIAGLAAARALAQAGIADVHLLELEDASGGNSRGHAMGGMACPRGAHYLPLPGTEADEVAALLAELGLARRDAGRTVYAERHLCHSPQERLLVAGEWHDGLLPPPEALPAAERADTRSDYRRFARLVADVGAGGGFRIPTARAPWTTTLAALDAVTFTHWLDAQGLRSPALRWYLDYCCRDDYGAGAAMVSAWAGLHYFASRHGFRAPGEGEADEDVASGVFTWPEGNAWLAQRLAAPLAGRLHTGRVALRVAEARNGATVDALEAASGRIERWSARAVVLAVPLHIAARLHDRAPNALVQAVASLVYAPWLVANVQLSAAPLQHIGAPPSWDNVRYGADDLGYVDAMHQSTRPHAGATVLTAYHALGGASAAELATNRRALLDGDAAAWGRRVVADLSAMLPDVARRIAAVDLVRHGHAMAIPRPGVRASAALQAVAESAGRIRYAHADLSGYSVFEEALYHGDRAGRRVAALLTGRRPAG
jgi:monoamine oxidase